LWLADESQVRGPRLVHALASAAMQRGARIAESTTVLGLCVSSGRVKGVRTTTGTVHAETVVLAAGVWSPQVVQDVNLHLPVKPVKGQILSVRALGKAPRQVLWCGEAYLVPRPDGEIVLGATEEEGNYDARPTLAGLHRLTQAALEVVPAVAAFTVDGFWAGLRPAAPDRFPIVGWVHSVEGLFIATAHYRNGILLGPLTGRRVAEHLVTGGSLGELTPFAVERFEASPS
jgi:glycine oxidase